MKVWVDVGGTFTDCFVVDHLGQRLRGKVLSSGATKGRVGPGSDAFQISCPQRRGDPADFWVGFDLRLLDAAGEPVHVAKIVGFDADSGSLKLARPLQDAPRPGQAFDLLGPLEAPVLAVRRLLALPLSRALPPMEVRLGTTRGTNALLTRGGARAGLATTCGFGDCLRIGTQERPELFNLAVRKAPPLTDRVVEIDERLAADGSVLRPLDESRALAALERLRAEGVESLAICLLHAYRNDMHERRVEQLARRAGFTEISLSSQVAPLIKLVSRAETTTLDAYLNPILNTYVDRVWQQFGGPARCRLRIMTSGGQLVGGDAFRGRDSILSGPAGGVVALAAIGDALRRAAPGRRGVIGFDMGGTSTDVSRYEGRLVRQFESRKAGIRVMTPMMAIHTVAAGGGSICQSVGGRLLVGPQSAGSDPGPACYGRGGPLTVTDLNVLLGRIAEDRFPFRLDRAAAQRRLDDVMAELRGEGLEFSSAADLAAGFWRIAVHLMAEAVRTVTTSEGADPRPMALVGFGGAAGQHACAVAEALEMDCLVDHPEAGMFSALGMGLAPVGRFASQGIYRPVDELPPAEIRAMVEVLGQQTRQALSEDLAPGAEVAHRVAGELRYLGSDTPLEVVLEPLESLSERFHQRHQETFGYARTERRIELTTVRVDAESRSGEPLVLERPQPLRSIAASQHQQIFIAGQWLAAARYDRDALRPGDVVSGPALITGETSTLVVEPAWRAAMWSDGSIVAERDAAAPLRGSLSDIAGDAAESESRVDLEIVACRLQGIAEQMGEVLRRTAVSVNVKERLDYSCAVFRGDGSLVAGAMHVPVHLGAMGHTVRHILAAYPRMAPGDCYVSNDPYCGGSHLPDVTLVHPVFVEQSEGRPEFFVATRAHHAEIGGMTPGSMPPGATNLAEEGVVIRNFPLLVREVSHWRELSDLLAAGPYPSRTPQENLADIEAQIAAGRRGAADIRALAVEHGAAVLDRWMSELLDLAADSLDDVLARIGPEPRRFTDSLDDGSRITVALSRQEALTRHEDRLVVDFAGTSGVHGHGWNATPSIVSAAVLYVLRCLSPRPLPLSEGVLRRIDLRIPSGLLNPPSHADPARCPAVVAGNVETSQRVVDCLLGALGVAAASQGTMNNLLVGDVGFGYYETICGGAGAVRGTSGEDAVHTHMTNTRITDPEVLETRYPLRLWRFSIRRGSGGAGRWTGGDGVIREIEVLRKLTITLLTGRRRGYQPYGVDGGQSGMSGRNILVSVDGQQSELPATVSVELDPGERIRIETPGGGGWGTPL